MEFKVGDPVRFKMGRGFGEGKIVKIEYVTAIIHHKTGTLIKRPMGSLFEPKTQEEEQKA